MKNVLKSLSKSDLIPLRLMKGTLATVAVDLACALWI